LDHDIDLTPGSADFGIADIPIPEGDDIFRSAGCTAMIFSRSMFVGSPQQRNQVNVITSFIDASAVYGSDEVRADILRTKMDGLLKTSSDGRMLPFNTEGLENAGGDGRDDLFLAGDVRANEQAGLTAMHTLFVREHNRLATAIARRFKRDEGTMGEEEYDEKVYQLARKLVGAGTSLQGS